MSDHMLISIITMLVEALEMSYNKGSKNTALVSDVCLQEVKFILNQVRLVISLGTWPDLDQVSFPY